MSLVNKKAAERVTPFFEVRKSKIQGYGCFATQRIRKGQRLIEYQGEVISNEEADIRYDESKMRRHHTFLFTLDKDSVIDGAVNGNGSIYINHSCEPNCEAVIEKNRIYIEALKNIEPGEELLYDYQYERDDDPEMLEFYKCLCGAPTCRGTIMKAPTKRKSRKKATAKKSVRKGTGKKAAKKAAKKTTTKSALKKGVKKAARKAVKKTTAKKLTRKKATTRKGVKKTTARVLRSAKKAVRKAAKKGVKKSAAKKTRKNAVKAGRKAVKKTVRKAVKKAGKKTTRRR